MFFLKNEAAQNQLDIGAFKRLVHRGRQQLNKFY